MHFNIDFQGHLNGSNNVCLTQKKMHSENPWQILDTDYFYCQNWMCILMFTMFNFYFIYTVVWR